MDYEKLPKIRNDEGKKIKPKKHINQGMNMNLPILYRSKDGRVDIIKIWSCGDVWYSEWGKLDGKMQRIERKGEVKNDGKSNMLSPSEDALYQAYSHWRDMQEKKGYDVDLIDVEEQFPLIPMTSADIRKRMKLKSGFDWEKRYYIQRKLDGHRMTSGINPKTKELEMVSRGRKEIHHISHIRDELEEFHKEYPRIYLDGELFPHDEYRLDLSRQKISSIVRQKNEPHKEEYKISYCVFDCYFPDEPEMKYKKRLRFLSKVFKDSKLKNIKLIETMKSDKTKEFVEKCMLQFVDEKYEGAMIKTRDGIYKPGKRSNDSIKMKPYMEDEFPIVDFTEGTDHHKGMIIFICITKDGQKFNSVPSWTHEKRTRAFKKGKKYMGKLAVISYFSLSDDGIPEFNNTIDIKD